MTNTAPETIELLDVVDENDAVIAIKPRTEIHREGLLHREIHIWMFDKEKNVLFQKRAQGKNSAGLLDATIGGHVDRGEDYLTSALREGLEETGIVIQESDLVLLKKFRETSVNSTAGTTNNFFRTVYMYKNPIAKEALTKEAGLIGVDFEKISLESLSQADYLETSLYTRFILTEEIPTVLEYLSKID